MNISQTFWSFLAKPLEDKQVPTPLELQNWLVVDQTNTIEYHFPDFDCKAFATTLVLHARAQKLQMGLVCVYGYDTSTHEEWNHAFNLIFTTEGLFYVEPQTAKAWSYADHSEIQAGNEYDMWQYDPPRRIRVDRVETILPP